jgi:hypothetical protein
MFHDFQGINDFEAWIKKNKKTKNVIKIMLYLPD